MIALFVGLLMLASQAFEPRTGELLAASLMASGLPITDLVIHTAESDPNHFLGRPGQYITKVSWNDARFPSRLGTDRCCTIEAFDDWHAYIARINYTTYLRDNIPMLGGEWIERSDTSMSVLRLDRKVTPATAAEYRAWLGTL